ncbi:MAG: molecular chaperone SurA, partial [Rubrivivax sp.]
MTRLARIALACLAVTAALPLAAQLRAPSVGAGPRLALPAPSAAPSTGSATRQADYIVAVVNSEPITNNEVRTRALRFQQQLSQQGGAVPSARELLSLTLTQLISERAQLQHARDIGIKVEEGAIDQAEASIAAQNQLEVAELRRRIQSEGLGLTQFRDDLRNQLLLQRLRERDFEARVRISDLEADQFLAEQRRNVDPSKAEINIAQILVAVPESATPAQVAELKAKAQQAYDRARTGADFTALVREFSNAPQAGPGGQMGMRPADRYPQLFVDAVKPLAVGAVAAPVQSGAGFHVLKLVERNQPSAVDSTVPEARVRHIL